MNWRMAGMALITLLLASCDDDEGPAGLTGVFRAGGAAGVHYATSTRSGTTDSAGTFRYLPGERVYFSIGGIKLGSAPGAAEITPFTLAGTTPPVTELALRGELERTRRTPTSFGRALNIEYLLVALDGDHNPANGLDVTAKAGTLAGVDLDVGLHHGAFLNSLQRRITGLTANVPHSYVVAYLYRALGIRVPAHADTRAELRHGMSSPSITTNNYGADGSHVSQASDNNDDGEAETSTSWTYDSLGRIRTLASQYPAIFFPYVRNFRYEYDTRGIRTGSFEDTRFQFFGDFEQAFHSESRFTRDAHDFTLSEIVDTDTGNDGTVNSRYTNAFTYDARHNVIRQRFETDFDLDGRLDETSTYSVVYDERDRITHLRDEYDRDGDGVADQRYESSREYTGNHPGSSREVAVSDHDADGIADARYVIDTVYDASGSLQTRVERRDENADGVVDTIYRNAWTYDAMLRPLSQEQGSDYDGDGNFDFMARGSFSYDGVGNLLASRVEYDTYMEGAVNALMTDTYQYGPSGELLGATSSSVTDGLIDFPVPATTTVTNVVIPDGVLMLAQRYLENFPGVVPIYPGVLGGGVVGVAGVAPSYVDSLPGLRSPGPLEALRASY